MTEKPKIDWSAPPPDRDHAIFLVPPDVRLPRCDCGGLPPCPDCAAKAVPLGTIFMIAVAIAAFIGLILAWR